MSDDSAADARYDLIAEARAASGAGRPLGRAESVALDVDMDGPVPDDPDAAAWIRHLFGEIDTPAA